MISRVMLAPLALAGVLAAVVPVTTQRGRGPAVSLPEGDGKALVEAQCSRCHTLNNLTISWGYTRDGWERLFGTMVALPAEQRTTIADYLAKNFPEKPHPSAVLIPGTVSVSIKEWVVPSLGSRPHDPLAASDGSIWWTGQWATVLGRLDPRTGVMEEFPLPTPGSGPHGLTEDSAGNIWYTGKCDALIGKLDPKTGAVTRFTDARSGVARSAHAVFDHNGRLWFRVQGANMVGRLVPQTGDIKLVTMPTPRALPYGIVVNSAGVPFVVEFGTNKVASLDPVTMAVREVRAAECADPSPAHRDHAGRRDLVRGLFERLPGPAGSEDGEREGVALARRIAVAAIRNHRRRGNAIWYSESAVRPNTVVRFDPATEKFQTWAIPSGGGVVRNMMATKEGNLVLACSGVNRVALVEVK